MRKLAAVAMHGVLELSDDWPQARAAHTARSAYILSLYTHRNVYYCNITYMRTQGHRTVQRARQRLNKLCVQFHASVESNTQSN